MLKKLAADIEADPETAPGPAWHIESPVLSNYSSANEAYDDPENTEYSYALSPDNDDYASDDDDLSLPSSPLSNHLSPVSTSRTTPETALTADLAYTADMAWSADEA